METEDKADPYEIGKRPLKVSKVSKYVLRLPNQGVRVAGGEISMFNVDVGLHQRSALSPYFFTILMYVLLTDGLRK